MKRIFMLGALLVATGCASKQERPSVAPIRVETCLVTPSSEADCSYYVGAIKEERSAALSFPLAGTLARTFVDEGQYVARGTLVAELDPTSARQSHAAALAGRRETCAPRRPRCHLRNPRRHPANPGVAGQTLLQWPQAACGMTRNNLEGCSLRAPIAGVLGKRRS